jgi:hypothetical protein
MGSGVVRYIVVLCLRKGGGDKPGGHIARCRRKTGFSIWLSIDGITIVGILLLSILSFLIYTIHNLFIQFYSFLHKIEKLNVSNIITN